MKKSYFLYFFLTILTLTLLSPSSLAQSNLPPALQKIIEYNQQATASFSVKISFLIAFVAGIIGILSPCILPFLPAYFSYTFKEKKNITLMTLIFFAGFSLIFVTLGLIAGFVGEQTLVVLQKSWIVSIAGLILLFLGILTLTGKGFSSIFKFDHRFKNDIPGVFLMGMAFALGWTACLGPILAGILGIGAILGNPLQSGILLFFYSLGNLLPLFIISFFYDRFHLSENKYIKGKVIEFSLFKKKYEVHTTNLISGLLFIFLGLIMIIFGGTGKVNNWDLFNTKQYFYSLQNQLLRWHYANFVGIIILLLLLGIILHTFIKSKKLVRI